MLQHERIALSITYAFGDIHGCLSQLQRLVELCERDAGPQKIKLIFLGDYIDRGPDSRGVVDFLIDLQTWSPDEIFCLRGNHEDLLLSAIEDEAKAQLAAKLRDRDPLQLPRNKPDPTPATAH